MMNFYFNIVLMLRENLMIFFFFKGRREEKRLVTSGIRDPWRPYTSIHFHPWKRTQPSHNRSTSRASSSPCVYHLDWRWNKMHWSRWIKWIVISPGWPFKMLILSIKKYIGQFRKGEIHPVPVGVQWRFFQNVKV